jgi:hypothetical protein
VRYPARIGDLSPRVFLLILQRLGVGLREAFHLEHLLDIATVDEHIGHEAIVDILAMCTLWKESSVMRASYSAGPLVCESRRP